MTTVNASNSTEALDFTPFSNQISFSTRDPDGGNSPTGYSWITTGGDDVAVLGSGIDFNGNPPAFGLVSVVEIDLSNTGPDVPADVRITNITPQNGGGNQGSAQLALLTAGAQAFFTELFSHGDIITAGNAGDTIKAGGGTDLIDLRGGNDTALGEDGSDIILGGTGNDSIQGNAGNDDLSGEQNNDQLDGGVGNDTLSGGSGFDTVSGGADNDTVFLTSVEIDDVDGGAGIDTIDARPLGTSLNLDLLAGTIKAGIFTTQEVGVENATGSGLTDTLNGDAANNRLDGAGGSDKLNGGEGVDTLIGGAGKDQLSGGGGRDSVSGGDDDDTILFSANAVLDDVDGGNGIDEIDAQGHGQAVRIDLLANTIQGLGGTFTETGVENVDGSTANDTIRGDNGTNRLRGAFGDDLIDGGAGNDVLDGVSGNDTLIGGFGNDDVFGGQGDDVIRLTANANLDNVAGGIGVDTLDGSLGASITVDLETEVLSGLGGTFRVRQMETVLGSAFADTLSGDDVAETLGGNGGGDVMTGRGGADIISGGAGADRFVFLGTADSGGTAIDRIRGFDGAGAKGGDLIDLGAVDAVTTIRGDQAFTFLGDQAAGFVGSVGELWLENRGQNTFVFGNTDTDATVELGIEIEDGSQIAAGTYVGGDFVL